MKILLVASLSALCGLPALDHTPSPDPRADEQRQDADPRDMHSGKEQAVRKRPTAMDQGSSQSDIDITARVRRALVDADGLSSAAENVLVVTRDGVVSIVGDIDEQEHQRVLGIVRATSGVNRVEDFINCCPKTGKPLHPAQDGRTTDRSPMSDQDREYDRRIREVWAQDDMVRDRVGDVRMTRSNGVLHITGTVPDEATRRRLIESLEKQADGHRISDGLTIGASPAGSERSDAARGKQGNSGATDTTGTTGNTRPVDPAAKPDRNTTPGNTGSTR